MKRPLIKAAAILNTLLFLATLAADGYLIYQGWALMVATVQTYTGGGIAAAFTYILALVTSIVLLLGIVATIYSIIMLSVSAKLIKRSSLNAEQFQYRKRGIIAYIVFLVLTFAGAIYLSFAFADSLIRTCSIIGAAVLGLSIVLIIAGLIIKPKEPKLSPEPQPEPQPEPKPELKAE